MNFVLKKKKSKVKYTLLTEHLEINNFSRGIFNNVEKKHNYTLGCPSVTSLDNRLYTVNSPFSVDITFDKDVYKYNFDINAHPDNENMHQLLKKTISINTNKNISNLQVLTPYAFITDDKDIELVTLEPNIKYKNCKFVEGSLMPYSWIRTINSAWILEGNEANINYRKNKPLLNFLFNKPVDLEYVEPNKKIYDYWRHCKDITIYSNNVWSHYKHILHRRPKNML